MCRSLPINLIHPTNITNVPQSSPDHATTIELGLNNPNHSNMATPFRILWSTSYIKRSVQIPISPSSDEKERKKKSTCESQRVQATITRHSHDCWRKWAPLLGALLPQIVSREPPPTFHNKHHRLSYGMLRYGVDTIFAQTRAIPSLVLRVKLRRPFNFPSLFI